MTFSELKEKLAQKEGRVMVVPGTLGGAVDAMLRDYMSGGIVIEQITAWEAKEPACEIRGRASFLNCDGLEIVLTAWLDENETVQLLAEYTVSREKLLADEWKFSTSFPALPKVGEAAYLDRLSLKSAAFAVASGACRHEKEELREAGIYFFGTALPNDLFGAVWRLLEPKKELKVRGRIFPVRGAEILPPLGPRAYPWEPLARGVYCPGVFLTIMLEAEAKAGPAALALKYLHIYSPPSLQWLRANDSYYSFFTYEGMLTVEGTAIQAAFYADYDPDIGTLVVQAAFSGVSLSNLGELAGLAGGDLAAYLPGALQALSRVELTSALLWLSEGAGGLSVEDISLTVGIPELCWQVWPEHFSVHDIFTEFRVSAPFGARTVSARVYGTMTVEGVALAVSASDCTGFTLYAQTLEGIRLPLREFLSRYLPQIPPVSDLTVDTLSLLISPSKSYQMDIRLAGESGPWLLDLGVQKLAVSNVALTGVYADGTSHGFVRGTLHIGELAALEMVYRTPGDIVMRAGFPQVSFSGLLSALCGGNVSLPAGFDLQLTDSSILIEKAGADYHFLLATSVEQFGLLALEVKKTAGSWGAAAGLCLAAGKMSGLPGFGLAAAFESMFSLSSLVLVISSFSETGFTFPEFERFENPRIAGGRLALSGGGLCAGVNFYGRWTLNAKDQKHRLLRSILGLESSIGVTLQVGKDGGMCLYVDCQTQLAGHPLACKFGGRLQSGAVSLFLEGSVELEIQGSRQTFSVALDFVPNGAYLAATNRSGVPIDYGPFKLGNLAVEAGFNWEGVPSFGVAGTISSGSFESSIAVFFDSAQPSRSLVAGAVSDLTLKDVLDTFLYLAAREDLAGELTDFGALLEQFAVQGTQEVYIDAALSDELDGIALQNVADALQKQGINIPSCMESVFFTVSEPGSVWFLTDLTNKMRHYQFKRLTAGEDKIRVSVEAQVYCAPQRTQIGSLPVYERGFYVNACLLFFGYRASATVEIDAARGFSFSAQMDKIVLGSEMLFCLSAAEGDGGPELSCATYGDPYLHINGKLSLLGLETSIFLNANRQGLTFDINKSFFSVLTLNAHGTVGSPASLNFGGEISVALGTIDLGPLGSVNIDSGVGGRIEITVNGQNIQAGLRAGFALPGKRYDLAELELDVTLPSLRQLPQLLKEKVKTFLKNLYSDAQTWANDAAKGIIKGVYDITEALCRIFGLPEQTARKMALRAFEFAQEICPITSAVSIL